VYTLILDTLDYSFLFAPVVLCRVHTGTWYSGLFILDYPCRSVSRTHWYSERQGQARMNNPEYQVSVCTRHRTTGACRSVSCTHWYLILWIIHSWLPLSYCVVYSLILDTLDYSFLFAPVVLSTVSSISVYETQNDMDNQEWIIQSIKYQCVHDTERQGKQEWIIQSIKYQCVHDTEPGLFILVCPYRSVSRTHWYLILWIIHSCLPMSFCVGTHWYLMYQCVHDTGRQGQTRMNNPEYQVSVCTRHRTTGIINNE
jgi:hypothetical protein